MGRAAGSLRVRAGSARSFPAKAEGYSQAACRARPFFRPLRLVCWPGYKEFLTGEVPAGCSPRPWALPSWPCPAVPGRTEWAPAGAAVTPCLPREQALLAANTEHNRPLGELTHRKRPGLMSKLVHFPDDGAEEAEAAHRSPWTPPAHECEPAAAAGLSWEGHGPSGTARTVPSPEAAPRTFCASCKYPGFILRCI